MSMTDYEALKAKAKEESRHSTPIKKDPRNDIFPGTYDSEDTAVKYMPCKRSPPLSTKSS